MKKEMLMLAQNALTKTQYKYWYAYYVLDLNLQDIATEYGVHITTVSHVLNNARRRLFSTCGGVTNG